MVGDAEKNNVVDLLHLPVNEHLLAAITGSLNSLIPAAWTKAKQLLSDVFKERKLAEARLTKSGSHEKDFCGACLLLLLASSSQARRLQEHQRATILRVVSRSAKPTGNH